MEASQILRAVEHTLLAPGATWEEIRQVCDDALTFNTAAVCVPPSFVRRVREYLGDRMAVTTVVGFPSGYSTTAVKAYEAADAIDNGADEIDTVVNLGWVKEHRWEEVLAELRVLRTVCRDRVLKVIVETCLLTQEEKTAVCHAVARSGADYIKTSTGFNGPGAAREDVALFASLEPGLKIKAAGGISSFADAEDFLRLGAVRLGTSRLVKLAKEDREGEIK